MSQHYSAQTPADGSLDPTIRDFFSEFYAISDSPDAHEKYADQFTKNGVLIIASKKVQGHNGQHTYFPPSFS